MNKTKISSDIEILSPAGSYDSVIAAVLNGANAVYLGQKNLNARQNAANFDGDELKRAIEFCHLHNVFVYQTLNTIVFDDEIKTLEQTLKTACDLCVDALIVQDLGVLRYVKEHCPSMPIHASTQMTVHTKQGAIALKEMGVSRVVLAREMSLAEIKDITDNVDIEVEVFVHGALCMSVSGQCYMSSAIGGRSANKGNCAGACRLPHSVSGGGEYALSLKDLCAVDLFSKLKEANVRSLKIEGRMKRPEYVAAATRAYAELKNGIYPDMEMLQAVFSRNGFTDGYLSDQKKEQMFGFRGKEDVSAATSDVFKQLAQSYHKLKPMFAVDISLSLKRDETAKLTLSDMDGHKISVEGEIPQVALNKPLDADSAREALQKLGNTPYYLGDFSCEIDDGLMLPKSSLNKMRREAIEKLDAARLTRHKFEFTENKYEAKRRESVPVKSIRARFFRFEQIPFDLVQGLEYIYLPIDEVCANKEKLSPIKDKIIIEPYRLMLGVEEKMIASLQALKKDGFDKLSLSNISHIKIGKDLGYTLFGTSFLNITNSYALEEYKALGVCDTEVSIEVTTGQINKLSANNLKIGVVGYGKMPLMLFANCPIKANIGCKKCGGCGKITDRLSNEFEIICNRKNLYSELINCNPIYVGDKQRDFKAIDFFSFYFTTQTKSECSLAIKSFLEGDSPSGNFTRGLYYRGLTSKT